MTKHTNQTDGGRDMTTKAEYRSFTVQGATEWYRRGTFGYDLLEFVEATIARAESAEAANRALLRERAELTEDAAVDRASAAWMAYPRTRGITPHDEAMRAALRAALDQAGSTGTRNQPNRTQEEA